MNLNDYESVDEFVDENFDFLVNRLINRIAKTIFENRKENNMSKFKEGELIIYQNGERFEIGKIKRITENGAFVYYHSGDTASKTPFDCMHKLENGYCIISTILGGGEQ